MKRMLSAASLRNPLSLILGIFILFFLVISGLPTSSNPVVSAEAKVAAEAVAEPSATPPAASGFARAVRATSATPMFAPSITATKVDALHTDVDSDGKADPGDTIMYTVTITNGGPDPATGVMFNDTIDANTTLVPGSVNASPLAGDDAYTTIGNTRLKVGNASVSGPEVVISGASLFDNDQEFLGDTFTLDTFQNPSANGGNVSINPVFGHLDYVPPVGFTGNDTFTYTIKDSAGKTSTATVTITVTNMVWYVNNAAAAGGDGRSTSPFNSLTPVNGAGGAGDADAAGHIIYVDAGSGSYTTGIGLENNQLLIGEGVALVVSSLTLNPAGSKPTITNSGGNGVTLANGNTVRGLIAQTTAAGGASAGIAGSSVGNLSTDTLQAVGNPGAAVDIQTAGTLAVTFESLSSTNGTRGMRLTSATGGTFTVTGATTITGTTGDGVTITMGNPTVSFSGGVNVTTTSGKGIVANAAGTLSTASSSTVNATGGAALDLQSMNFGTGLLFTSLQSTNSTAEGIKIQGSIQNLTVSGTTNIQTPTGTGIDIQSTFGTSVFALGTTTVNKTSAGTGVNLASNGTATIGFGALNITAGNGAGLVAATSGTVNSTSGAVSATSGPGLNLSSVTAGLTLTSVSSTNSGMTGISLASVSGGLGIGTTTITNPAQAGISETSSSATVNFGNATVNGSGMTGVVLGGSGAGNSGTITFADLDIAPDGSQRGLHAVDNTNTITTTSGTISASNAVAVEITRASSTTPLQISLTSVAANGGATGMILNNTSGSCTITGDGSMTSGLLDRDGSGGTIQNTTDDGVRLNNASNVTFRQMNFIGCGDTPSGGLTDSTTPSGEQTIQVVGGSNLILSAILIQNPVATGLMINNLGGTNRLDNNSRFDTFPDGLNLHGIYVNNANVNMTLFEIKDSRFTNFRSETSVVYFTNTGTSNMTLNVKGTTFDDLDSQALTVSGGGTAGTTGTLTSVIGGPNAADRNVFRDAFHFTIPTTTINVSAENNVALLVGEGATHNATLENNLFSNICEEGQIANTSIIRTQNFGGKLTATIKNNEIKDINYQTGAGGRHVIGHIYETSFDDPSGFSNLIIDGNTANNVTYTGNSREFVFVEYRPATGPNPSARGGNVTIKNNNWNMPTSGAQQAIELRFRQSIASTVNVLVDNNGNGVGVNGVTGATTNTANVFLDIDAEVSNTVNATVTNNKFTNPNGTPGNSINVTTEAAGSIMCANISGNNLSAAGNTIALDETAGTMNITQASAGAMQTANGGASVSVTGTPTFGAGACNTPSPSSAFEDIVINSVAESKDGLATLDGHNTVKDGITALSQGELSWMVHAAIERWINAGVDSESLARLQQLRFEIADLGEGQIASTTPEGTRIDETAAGYGWFFDTTPITDEEFLVGVPGRELQTTDSSLAHGRMDLLTVVMRALAVEYLKDKKEVPDSLRPLIEGTLSPSVRRLPDASQIGFIIPEPVIAQPPAPAVETASDATSQSAPAASQSAGEGATATPSAASPSVSATAPPSSGTVTPQAGETISVGGVSGFTLPANKSVTIMFRATINALNTLPAGTTQVCNQGTVSGTNFANVLTDDPDVAGSANPTCTPLDLADLIVTKTDSPDPVVAGQNITYTISFENDGPQAAANVSLSDTIPANTTFVSVNTPAGWTRTDSVAVGGTGTINFTKPTVADEETATFTLVVQVAASTADATVITNTASVTSNTPDTNTANNTDSETTNVIRRADLIISKTDSPDPVPAGQNITYTVNFENDGPNVADNTTITDAVPANTTFVSAVVTTGTGWMVSAPAVGGTGNIVFSKAAVANQETAVFTIVVKVNDATANGATITNTAVAASDTVDGTPANNTATATTAVTRTADLAVTKSDSPDPAFAGNNITYTINFTNNGPTLADNVTVTDAVPVNTTFVSAMVTTGTGWTPTTPAVGATGNVVFSKAAVPSGETAVFSIVVKINEATPNGTTIANTATVASTTTDPTPGNNSATVTTTANQQADLAVTKTDSPDPVFAGNNITYTVNLTNNGPGTASTVTVTDAVPANTTFVSAMVTTGTGWATSTPAVGATGNVIFSKAAVANTETAVFSIVVRVNSNTASGATITNSVIAASTTADPVAGDNTATAMTTVQTQADLSVTKTDAPDPVFAGNNLTYTVTVTNNGPSDAASVSLADAIPANTTFVSVNTPSGWTRTDGVGVGGTGTISFTNPALTAGASSVFTLVVNIASSVASTTLSNTATVATTTTDPNAANNSATATTSVQTQADLSVTKTDSPDPVVAGQNLTYTVSFVNAGPSDAQTVVVSDMLPANTTFVSAMVTSGSGWMPSLPAVGGSGTVMFAKATVAAGETAIFTLVVKVSAATANGTTISNTVTATSATTDPNAANNSSTATTSVQAQADLAVTKTDSPDPVLAGNNITYTVSFTNNGASDAQTVTVTDAVPANATFISAMVTSGTGWMVTAPPVGGTGNVVFSKAMVTAGETATFTIVVKVNSNTAAGTVISNTATAASTTTDPTPGNNSATAMTTVQAEANLIITKSSTPDPVFAGNNLTYTVNLVNNGPSDATSVTVTDAVPTNTTFVSAMVTTGSGWTPSLPAVGGTGNIVFSKTSVVVGETTVFTIVVNVNSNTAAGAMITNTATVTATTGDPVPADNTAVEITAVERRADLAVTKTDSPDPVFAGNDITYTVSFTNNGPSDADTVTVTDGVPANATFVSAMVTTGTGWSTSSPAVGGTGNIVFSKAAVVAGETATFTIVVKVNASTPNGSMISNTATTATMTTDPTAGNNSATATTTVQTQADLSVTKTDSPDPVFAGANITYTVNFVNNGPSDAQMVSLTDAIPTNTTFVSVAAPKDWNATTPAVGATGNVVFDKATVAAGETASFTVVVKVNSNTVSGTVISNTITTATTTTDPTSGNNSSTATTTVNTQADIQVTKTDSPDPVIATQNLTYTVTVTNNGPSDAQTLALADAVPANTTLVSVTTPTGWTRTDAVPAGGTGTLTFTRATQPAAAASVFTIVVNVNAATPHNTTITNTATATTATTDPNAGNNSATATTTVIAQADVSVTKSDAPDPACVSGDITYTLALTNNGPGPGINTTVTDAVPANTTFVSAMVTAGTGWTVMTPPVGGTGNVVFSKASVANGETAMFTVVVKVNAGTPANTVITNTATTASDIPDPMPTNNTAMTTTTVDPIAPQIVCPANVVGVTAPNCSPGAGAVVTYATPTVTDNCAGASVVCSPPSGSAFPVGVSTVNCTATDAAGNTASCSFTVKVFDICLQDNSNANTVLLINSVTGEYVFCCNGTTYTGVGTITRKGCQVSLQHWTGTRRVTAAVQLGTATKTGTASLQSPPGVMLCQITDSNLANNSCACSFNF